MLTRTEAALKAISNARRYAMPVALATGLLILPYGIILMSNGSTVRGILGGLCFAGVYVVSILAVWLGSAALVGWIRQS